MFRLYDKIKNGEVYIIAEMSANHGGSLDNALEIVRQSAEAGADCLKIQTYTADSPVGILLLKCCSEYPARCEDMVCQELVGRTRGVYHRYFQ